MMTSSKDNSQNQKNLAVWHFLMIDLIHEKVRWKYEAQPLVLIWRSRGTMVETRARII